MGRRGFFGAVAAAVAGLFGLGKAKAGRALFLPSTKYARACEWRTTQHFTITFHKGRVAEVVDHMRGTSHAVAAGAKQESRES